MSQGTILVRPATKWMALAALVAVLAVLLTASVVRAQENRTTISYPENGTDPVVTLTATDPEGDTLTWSLTGTGNDNADFGIGANDGVLRFNSAPDFEVPVDEGTDNTYVVEVTATDTAATPNTDTFTVIVHVTNVDEPGKVTWTTAADGSTADTPTLVQFEEGSLLTATAEDGDITAATKTFTDDVTGEVTGVTWKWYRGSTQISGADAEDNTYTVTDDDEGHRLRVEVSYRIVGNTAQDTASLTSDYPVLETRDSNTAPSFSSTSLARNLNEGEKGRAVGAPVTATDDGPGRLNYMLFDADGSTTTGDSTKFKIDQKTGQITTGVDLNYDSAAAADDNCVALNSCVVTVRATDSAGETTSVANRVTVTINILNVNDEKPVFVTDGSGPPAADSPTSITRNEGMTALADTGSEVDATYAATDADGGTVTLSLMGDDKDLFKLSDPASGGGKILSFKAAPDYENPTDMNKDNAYKVTVRASDGMMHTDRMVTVMVANVNEAPMIMQVGLAISGPSSRYYPENGMDAVGTYKASGPEAASTRWMLEGDDAGDFMFEGSGESVMLKFRTSPDYEMPMSMDGDNTYMVTLKAMEGADMDTHDVTVMVTNMDEMGAVTLSPVSPLVGMEITASLTDPDGMESGHMWQWSKSMTMDGDFMDINEADMASYTPVMGDVGYYLKAMVTYDDAEGYGKEAEETTTSMVASNSAPVFADGAMTTREVPENTAAGTNVGDPVMATDADNDELTYELSGTDAASFDLDSSTGQITVGMGTMLNHETKGSYSVMVTATDDEMATATINVTINVTDEDEPGTLTLSSMKPVVGTMLTGMLDEGDDTGEVEWQWSRSMTTGEEAVFTHIAAEEMSYTPTTEDVGYYLQVSATYDDGHGSKTLRATTSSMVVTALMAKHDANENGMIDRNEAIAALRSYYAEEIDRSEAISVLRLYLGN